MNTKKREKKARILSFKNPVGIKDDQDVSEVTRNLFTETWRSYLDQTSMAALKLDHSINPHKDKKAKIDKIKLSIV